MTDADRRGPRFEWDATAYDRVADPQARWGVAVLERLPLTGDETVLDAGCGTGRVTEALLSRLPRGHVVALDASESMLARAQHRLAVVADRITFVHADLATLTPVQLGAHASVDAVFSTATFHWVTDHARLFANLASVTRSGGLLVAQCGGEGNVAGLTSVVRSLGMERAGTREYASVVMTAARLAAAGYIDIDVWTNTEPTHFASAAQLSDFLEAVCLRESLSAMPEGERETLLREVVAALPGGVLDYVRLNMIARRGPDTSPGLGGCPPADGLDYAAGTATWVPCGSHVSLLRTNASSSEASTGRLIR